MTVTSETTRGTSPRSLADLPLHVPGSPDLRSGDRLLIWLARQQRWVLLGGILWGIAWMGLQAAVPAALGAGVQAATGRDTSKVLTLAAVVLALGIGQAIAGVMRHRKAVVNWIAAAARIQQLVARSAAELGNDLGRQVSTGEVVAVTASDVERIGSVFDVTARFAGAVIAFIGVGIVLVFTSRPLGLLVLVGLPLLSLVILPLLKPLEKRESIQREAAGQASALAADTIGGLRVLRGIGGEQLFVGRYQQASQGVRAAAVSTARVRSVLDALQVFLPGIFVVLVTWLGARLALDGQISVGELVAFYGYTAFLVLPLRTITEAADKFTRGRVAARRVVSLMSIQRDESSRAAALRTDNPNLNSLPEALALIDTEREIDIAPGTLTGIVCADPSTAGELANRLAGYGEQSAGVQINGIAIEAFSLDDLRETVVLQDKDPVILSGTLTELLLVPGSDVELLPAATDAACADDVIEGLGGDPADIKGGYSAVVPERGRTLSGGQRQRLSLDRSLMTRAPILILDEPTSAVDAHTEARIAARLHRYRAGQTTVVFTTSPLVLDQCDHVLFAPDGVVTTAGHHHDLVHSNPDYRAVVIRGDE